MNDYIIGYDKGIKKDRSSLIISKYNNSNLYVLTEFYDEKADLLNEIITNLQQENKQLKGKIDKAIEYIKHSQSYGTMAQIMPHLKPYVNGDELLEILGDKE